MRGTILVEQIFRGRKKPKPLDIGDYAYRADFQLISKSSEADYLQSYEDFQANKPSQVIFPRSAPFPPLWKV